VFDGKSAESDFKGPAPSQKRMSAGYDYLLSMPLWSLTMERVEELTKQRTDKKAERDTLIATAPRAMWTADLDAFLVALEAQEKFDEDERKLGTAAVRQHSHCTCALCCVLRALSDPLCPVARSVCDVHRLSARNVRRRRPLRARRSATTLTMTLNGTPNRPNPRPKRC
jgi:hypothetical protein